MKRIQRKRTKGFNLQQESLDTNGLICKYVGRPSKYGNPFSGEDNETLVAKYRKWLEEKLLTETDFLEELRGHNLACFCPLDKPCHVDVILEFLAK